MRGSSLALTGAMLLRVSAVVLLLGGCASVADPPHRHSFLVRLEPPAEPGNGRHTPLGAVYIAPVAVSAPFSERNLVVRQSDLGYVVDPYAEFAASPMSMWTDAVRNWLDERRLFERVLPIASTAEADLTLETSLLEAVVDRRAGQPPSSRLMMRFLLIRSHTPYQVLLDRTFTHTEPVKGAGAEGEVAALSQAANAVMRDFGDALERMPN